MHHAAVRHWGDTSQGSWRQAGWAALRRAESGYRAAALLNLLVFLRTGKYRCERGGMEGERGRARERCGWAGAGGWGRQDGGTFAGIAPSGS